MEEVRPEDFTLVETQIEEIGNLKEVAGHSPIIKLVNYLIYNAVRDGASDVHVEPDEKKTRVQRQSARQSITGIVVNNRPGVPRDLARRLRAILHRAKTQGLAAQNQQHHPHFEAWLDGMIAYISMVNPRQAAPLRQAFDAVRSR